MNTKITSKIAFTVLILTAALLNACSIAIDNSDSKITREIADKIATYTIPDGYSEEFAVDLMGYQLVSLKGKTDRCHLFLVQAPKDADVDVEALQKQAREMKGEQKEDKYSQVRIVETRSATVRGKEVPVIVGEGINSDDQPYREVSVLFEGNGGPVLLNISSPVDQWDWDQVNAFIASIK